ncbi:MAG: urate hydroxylase PuuD [Actinomycetota bacterium]
MQLFTEAGLTGAFKIGHVIVGVMWMGLLWFFNFVQVPAFAEMEPAARNAAMDKITWRALWWFRWAAAATVAFGILILGIGDTYQDGDYWMRSAVGPVLMIGILFGLVMFANVWLVIWPAQQIAIANARNLLAGGEADPNAAAAARRGAMASRQNMIFSLPLLVSMVGAGHFFVGGNFTVVSSGKAMTYLIIGIVILVVLELNALGMISGRGNTGLNVIYETHKNAMITGFGLIVLFYVLAEILLAT